MGSWEGWAWTAGWEAVGKGGVGKGEWPCEEGYEEEGKEGLNNCVGLTNE